MYNLSIKLKGVPWNLEPSDDQIQVNIIPEFDTAATERIEAKPAPYVPQTRRAKLNARDFKEFGFTPKCAGCNAMRNNLPNPGHNEECRNRIEECLSETEYGMVRLQQAQQRQDNIIARQIEQQEQQNKKRKTEQATSHQTDTQQASSSSSSSGINLAPKRSAPEAEGGGARQILKTGT